MAAKANRMPFLIGTPKRLEIAVTPRKQLSRVISNRYKNGGLQIAKTAAASPMAGHWALDVAQLSGVPHGSTCEACGSIRHSSSAR
jgi:hypothetical protein